MSPDLSGPGGRSGSGGRPGLYRPKPRQTRRLLGEQSLLGTPKRKSPKRGLPRLPRYAWAGAGGAILGLGILFLLVHLFQAFMARRAAEAAPEGATEGATELVLGLEEGGFSIAYDAPRGEIVLARRQIPGESPHATPEDLTALIDAMGGIPLPVPTPIRLKLPEGPAVMLSPEQKIYDGDEVAAYLRAGPGSPAARLRAVLLNLGRRSRETWKDPGTIEKALLIAARARGGEIGEAQAKQAARILWGLGEIHATGLSIRW